MTGDAAPSQQQAGTVQRQDPPSGTRLRRREAVQLWVYREPAPQLLTVPDLPARRPAWPRPGSRTSGWWPCCDPAARRRRRSRRDRRAAGPATRAPGGDRLGGHADCVSGTGALRPAHSPPAVHDCSRWPGSVAVRDPISGTSRCDCPEGPQWNSTGTACEAAVNADQQYCDANWPGTTARREPATGVLECQCPAGLGWDDRARACVAVSTIEVQPILPGQGVDCSHMPGTMAFRDPATGQTQCRCPAGSWDAAQRRCVTEALPPSTPPSAPATTPASGPSGPWAGWRTPAGRRTRRGHGGATPPTSTMRSRREPERDRTGTGTGTGTGIGTGGGSCEDLGRSLSEPLFQGSLSRQEAERRMVPAGCGDQLDALCP